MYINPYPNSIAQSAIQTLQRLDRKLGDIV